MKILRCLQLGIILGVSLVSGNVLAAQTEVSYTHIPTTLSEAANAGGSIYYTAEI